MPQPTPVVELALTSGVQTPAASRVWTDISPFVLLKSPITIDRGRSDQLSTIPASKLDCLFDNTDGRFTPEYATGAYYPNIKLGRPIRVRALVLGNLLSTENASNEAGGTIGYGGGGSTITLANSTTVAKYGTKSIRGTAAAGSNNGVRFCGTWGGGGAPQAIIGQQYTISIWVYVPAATAFDLSLTSSSMSGIVATPANTGGLKDQWVRLSITGTATATNPIPSVQWVTNPQAGGEIIYMDGAMVQEGSALNEWTDLQASGPNLASNSPCYANDPFTAADSTTAVWDGPSGPSRNTPTGAYPWVGGGADWGILTNQAYKPVNSVGYCTIDPADPNVVVGCSHTVGATRNDSGLVVRYVDDNNHVRIQANAAGWRISKVVGGVVTLLATGGTVNVSTTYTLRVDCDLDTISVYVAGTLAVSATITDDVLRTATRVGLQVQGNTDHFWDSFWVLGIYTSSTRFLGYLDEIPVEWPGGSYATSEVKVTAASRRARTQVRAAFRSIVEEEIAYDNPVLYWPLGESDAATTAAGNQSPGRTESLLVVNSGSPPTDALVFGAGTGPGTDDLSTPLFAPTIPGGGPPIVDGKYLRANLLDTVHQSGDHALAMEAFITCTSTGDDQDVVRISLDDAYYPGASPLNPGLMFRLFVLGSTGRLWATYQDGKGGLVNAISSAGVTTGVLFHVAIFVEIKDSGNAAVKVLRNGVVEATSADLAWPYMSGGVAFFPTFPWLNVGGTRSDVSPTGGRNLFKGTISHVAIHRSAAAFAATRFLVHSDAGATGFSGEGSGARVQRYGRLAGIPTAEISAEAGSSTSMAHYPITGIGPVEAMDAIAQTEDGVVFDGKDGTLTFHGRGHRFGSGAISAFTLDCSAGNVEVGITPRLDDQGLLNDIQASRLNGPTIRVINAPSVLDRGYARADLDLITTSDTELQGRAEWEVYRRGTPRVAIPSVRVNLVNSGLETLLLAADIGTRITLANLPPQAPASSMDFYIEGISEEIGVGVHWMDFNLSPAVLSTAWVLDSATSSQLDVSTIPAY